MLNLQVNTKVRGKAHLKRAPNSKKMENYIYKLLQSTKLLEQKLCWDGIPEAINFIAVFQRAFLLSCSHLSYSIWSKSPTIPVIEVSPLL